MEDTFQRLKRLMTKGAENRRISVERLFHRLTQATRRTFPNVGQAKVSSDRLEQACGPKRGQAAVGVKAPLHRGSLAKAAYVPEPSRHWLPRPANYKTCRAAAYSQQVGFEECLLRCELAHSQASGHRCHANAAPRAVQGQFKDMRFLTKSWACGLVRTVSETAKNLLQPKVLAEEATSSVWLIVCSLGRCLLGWPLRLTCEEKSFFTLVRPISRALLKPIIVTDP